MGTYRRRKIRELAPESLGVPIPPAAAYHWTLSHQVNHLVSAREAEPDLGFMVRLMALCSLPRTNPGRRKEYKRVNGPFTLIMSAVGENGRLPYGNLPRLLLAWVSTEAVRTQRREKAGDALGPDQGTGGPDTRVATSTTSPLFDRCE